MTKASGFLIGFGLFWTGMTLLFDGFIIKSAMQQVAAREFTSAPGKVLASEVTTHDSDDGTTYGVRVTYSYTVSGQEYTGDRLRYGQVSSSSYPQARKAAAKFPVGSPITVYYNPSDPQDALLRPGLTGGDLFMALFMTPFNAVMLGFWWFGWSRLMRRLCRPVAGGVKLRTSLQQTRARMIEYPPLASAIVATALLAFVSIFVVGFGFGGFNPSLRVAGVTWAVVLSGGILIGIWSWINTLQGKYDLVLDEMRSSIQLPLTCGRKTLKILGFGEVHDCYVETIERRGSEDSVSHTYVPTLRLAAADGPLEKLAEWHDAERAREFVAWLNEKLRKSSLTQI